MLLAVVAKMVFVGIPTFKQTKNAAPMVIDALAIVCAIIAIAGLFLPTAFSAKNAEKGATYVLNMVRAALALLNIGAPMVLAGTVVNSVIAFKESK
ncbi:MAG: hypothetical protein MJ200_02245 [Mycoplasmoidaceae bacterium]|nr:hypothetical protein [Mycoplasmoidaceae bacterium]